MAVVALKVSRLVVTLAAVAVLRVSRLVVMLAVEAVGLVRLYKGRVLTVWQQAVLAANLLFREYRDCLLVEAERVAVPLTR